MPFTLQTHVQVVKVPDDIAAQMAGDSVKVSMFFDTWCAHSEDWGKVSVFWRKVQRQSMRMLPKQRHCDVDFLGSYCN